MYHKLMNIKVMLPLSAELAFITNKWIDRYYIFLYVVIYCEMDLSSMSVKIAVR